MHFWKLEFNGYLVVQFLLNKDSVFSYVQRMLKMSRVYTLAEILNKIFGKKKQRKIKDLIYDHDLKN